MNDRFKFRVWDKKEKRYINFEQFKKGDIEFNFNPQTNEIWIEYDKSRYVVEQCTGLKDKNSKLIYEGDIVTCGDDRKWVIIWGDSFWQVKEIRQDCCININALTWCNCDELEVIGNIHEHHELIEQSNDD